jgi:hypothetical protein
MVPASESFRSATAAELRLLRALVAAAGSEARPEWVEPWRVKNMPDGGMGGLTLAPRAHGSAATRTFGRCVAAVRFRDVDGVEVIASLNLDTQGDPFEVDVWKVDFSPLQEIASRFEPMKEI